MTAVGSFVLGPFFGIDRVRLKRELVDFWNIESQFTSLLLIRRVSLTLSWIGFLFPVVFPLPGFIAGLLFFTLFSLT